MKIRFYTIQEWRKTHPNNLNEMKIHHYLKCWPQYYWACKEGSKGFEIRINDRDYKVGENICLTLYDLKTKEFVENEFCNFKITYILYGGNFGINEEYVVMSIEKI